MALPVTYTTVTDVLRNLPSIGSISNLTSAGIHAFIGEAEAIINTQLAALYTVPVSGAPPLLQVVGTDLAIYRIMRRSFSGEKVNKSEWLDRYSEANSLLVGIAKGMITLTDSAGAVISRGASALPWSNTTNYTPIFDVGESTDQVVDPDRLDDIEDARL